MKRPWSISTTVRNPERLRDFLKVLKLLEGLPFNNENQIKFQVLLIQNKLYTPTKIPTNYKNYYVNPEEKITYKIAENVFEFNNYEDPPMRGRQSVNPLNKLGFSIARESEGPIKITELGNNFLSGDYDIGYVFFKSLLKLQYPNPWSTTFPKEQQMGIRPLVAVLHLINEINKKSDKKGLSRTEFSMFVPTFININDLNFITNSILELRGQHTENKEAYMENYLKNFYETDKLNVKYINNLYDYGDNTMRYFRLTKYFRFESDPIGYHWSLDLEQSRLTEIHQLLETYNGSSMDFKDLNSYLEYLSDISLPKLPWEDLSNLKKVVINIRNDIKSTIKEKEIFLEDSINELLKIDINFLTKVEVEKYHSRMRKIWLDIIEKINKENLKYNMDELSKIILELKNQKQIKKFKPEQFEKIISEALKIINDEIQIKPNYPIDDRGLPINHAPGNKADIECYYKNYSSIYEVTLNTSHMQWVQEGQPVMRHLRNFENQNNEATALCIFIAPTIKGDTYSQFWISVKHYYDGKPQMIIPLNTDQFATVLETILYVIRKNKSFPHKLLLNLFFKIVDTGKNLNSFSKWAEEISEIIENWNKVILS